MGCGRRCEERKVKRAEEEAKAALQAAKDARAQFAFETKRKATTAADQAGKSNRRRLLGNRYGGKAKGRVTEQSLLQNYKNQVKAQTIGTKPTAPKAPTAKGRGAMAARRQYEKKLEQYNKDLANYNKRAEGSKKATSLLASRIRRGTTVTGSHLIRRAGWQNRRIAEALHRRRIAEKYEAKPKSSTGEGRRTLLAARPTARPKLQGVKESNYKNLGTKNTTGDYTSQVERAETERAKRRKEALRSGGKPTSRRKYGPYRKPTLLGRAA